MASGNSSNSRNRRLARWPGELAPSVAAALEERAVVLNECRVNHFRRAMEERWQDLNRADRALERLLDPTDTVLEWCEDDQFASALPNPDQEERA